MGFRHYFRKGTKARLIAGERVNWIHNRPTWRYIERIVLSVPNWTTADDKREIRMLAQWCDVMEIMTGKPHCIDHITPVAGETFCGLSVIWNFQVIPRKVNESKGNSYYPEQIELFPIRNGHTAIPTYGPA